jgi:hypothetical protein
VASGRMRLAMGLTVVGAALLITGLLMTFVGEAQRLRSAHSEPGIVRTGEFVAVCGLGIGVALLVAMMVGRADRGRADRSRADRSGRGKRRRAGAPRAGPRRDLADERLGRRHDPADERLRPPLDPADEWLSPLRTAGAGLVPQRGLPSWPEPAEQSRPGSDDYTDDGWHPDMAGWDPGPAYVWNPRGEDDGAGGDRGWRPGGNQDWNHSPSPDVTTWLPDDLRRPGRNDQQPRPPAGPRHGYQNPPWPGYLSGPQHGYLAGPEPEQVSSPEGRYLSGPQAPYLADAGPAPRGGSDAGPASGDTPPVPLIRDAGEPASRAGRSEPAPVAQPASVWEPLSASSQEKLDQIKDLYLTAEAIGEDALVRHFDALSQRQRALIREYFERAGLRPTGAPTLLGGDSAENGAPLPG